MKDRLVQATLEEMESRSLKFTMDDLARKLHASKSSIYKIVDSKEDLIRLVMHWAMDKFDRKAAELLSGQGPVNRRLMAYCGLYFHTFWYLPDAVNEDLEARYEEIWKEVSVKFSSVIHLTVDNYYLRGFGLISISV